MQKNMGLTQLRDWGLIVVDMQNDFLASGGYYDQRENLDKQVDQGQLTIDERDRIMSQPRPAPSDTFRPRAASLNPIIANVLRLIGHARTNQRPIAYLTAIYGRQYEVVPPFLSLDLNRHHYPCHPKSWGSKLVEPVAKAFEARPEGSHEQVIEKHTYDGFFQTELLSFLIKHRVRTAVLVGAETQICVFATAKSAALHQFNTVIVEDGVWTSREDLGAGALTIFLEAYGSTAGSPAILEPKPHA